ncbi:unnamed protein product [Schistocephalus solidus]|uniref:Uncharacterized protein n=1 Tax=Schistocephalus solidus TaxID=70667 RepID=A0A183TTA7_SCHSO|nr:unnamed protein product [Schistocephalus solidus]
MARKCALNKCWVSRLLQPAAARRRKICGREFQTNNNIPVPIPLAILSRLLESNQTERRTALVTRELVHYKVDIAALSETRFSEQGQLEEGGAAFTLFWSGWPKAE